MPLTVAVFLVFALMTSVVVLLGSICGVQPHIRSEFGLTVAPFGPQLQSGRTPVLVAGANAPITEVMTPSTRVGPGKLCGSITNSPPLQVTGPASQPELQPAVLP